MIHVRINMDSVAERDIWTEAQNTCVRFGSCENEITFNEQQLQNTNSKYYDVRIWSTYNFSS